MKVFDNPATTWALTATLLLGACFSLLWALRSPRIIDRVNNSLHAVMNAVMVALLWHLATSTMLAQILFFSVAALWFLIQGVARPRSALCPGRDGRIKCLYHSLAMVCAALMVVAMGHVGAPGSMTAMEEGMRIPMGHHGHAKTAPVLIAGTLDHPAGLMLPLTVLFAVAAVVFFILLLRRAKGGTPFQPAAVDRLQAAAGHGADALGAASMALMFAAMAG